MKVRSYIRAKYPEVPKLGNIDLVRHIFHCKWPPQHFAIALKAWAVFRNFGIFCSNMRLNLVTKLILFASKVR